MTNVAPKMGAGLAPALSRSAFQGLHVYDEMKYLKFRFSDEFIISS
jgi:hypothetical protein